MLAPTSDSNILDRVRQSTEVVQDNVGIIQQFIDGVIGGFTTLPVGEDPDSNLEAVSRSVGSLLGFIGVIPGVGSVGSVAAKGTALGFRAASLGARTAGMTQAAARITGATLGASQRAARLTSVPLGVANVAGRSLSKLVNRSAAVQSSRLLRPGSMGREFVDGALHLGTASSVASWTGGVDAMVEGFAHGALFGVADKAVANIPGLAAIGLGKGGGPRGLRETIRGGGDEATKLAARSLSMAVYQGGLSTLRGDPMELQVYEYLLGAYFGGMGLSRHQRQAMEVMRPFYMNPGKRPDLLKLFGANPKDAVPTWDTLTKEAKAEVMAQAEQDFGMAVAVGDIMASVPEEMQADMAAFVAKQAYGDGTHVNVARVLAAKGMKDAVSRLTEEGKLNPDYVAKLYDRGVITEDQKARFDEGTQTDGDVKAVMADAMAVSTEALTADLLRFQTTDPNTQTDVQTDAPTREGEGPVVPVEDLTADLGRFKKPTDEAPDEGTFNQLASNLRAPADADLDARMTVWLNDHGFSVQKVKDIRTQRGLSALGMADILGKTVDVVEGRARLDTLPEETAHVALELMSHRDPVVKRLYETIESWEGFGAVQREYGKEYGNNKLRIRKEAAAKLVSLYLVRNGVRPDPISGSVWSRVKAVVQRFFGTIKTSMTQTNPGVTSRDPRVFADHVANRVLRREDVRVRLEPDAKRVEFERTLQRDPSARTIVQALGSLDAALTGSLAMRAQGRVYRTSDETLHDLDFSMPVGADEAEVMQQFRSSVEAAGMQVTKHTPQAIKHRDSPWKWTSYVEVTDGDESTYGVDLFFNNRQGGATRTVSGFKLTAWEEIFAAKMGYLNEKNLSFSREKDRRDLAAFEPEVGQSTLQRNKYAFFQIDPEAAARIELDVNPIYQVAKSILDKAVDLPMFSEIMEAYRDHDTPIALAYPLRALAADIFKASEKNEAPRVNEMGETLDAHDIELKLAAFAGAYARPLHDAARGARPDPDAVEAGYSNLVNTVKGQFDYDIAAAVGEGKNPLRQMWLRLAYLSNEASADTYDVRTGQLTKRGTIDAAGQRAERRRGLSLVDTLAAEVFERINGRPWTDADGPLRVEIDTVELPARLDKNGEPISRGRVAPLFEPEQLLYPHERDSGLADGAEVKPFDSVDFTMKVAENNAGRSGINHVVLYASKDKGRVLTVRSAVARSRALAEADAILRESDAAWADVSDRTKLRKGASSMREAFETNQARFVDRAVELGYNATAAKEIYAQTWANNVRYWETMQGMTLGEAIRAESVEGAQFIMDAAAMNKRAQVFDAGEVPVSAAAFDGSLGPKVEGFDWTGGLVVELVNGVADDGPGVKYPLSGKRGRYTYDAIDENGKVVQQTHDAHTDGVFTLRDDVFDGLATYLGWGSGTGSQKGVLTQRDNEGLWIGKYAYHRAGETQSAAWMERGVHGQMMDTAAKQRGKRQMYDRQLQVGDDGTLTESLYKPGSTHAVDPDDVMRYVVRPESMTGNMSTGESRESAMKDQTFLSQGHSNQNRSQAVDPLNPDAAIDAYMGWVRQGFRGVATTNAVLEDVMGLRASVLAEDGTLNPADTAARLDAFRAASEKAAETIRLDDVGLPELFRFFRNPVQFDHPLFRTLADQLMKRSADDAAALAESEMDPTARRDIMERLADADGPASQILAVVEPSPFVLENPVVRPFFEQALRNHAMRRVLRPSVKHSMKAVMAPYDPWLDAQMRAEGRPLQQGMFYLHDGMGDKPIAWKTGEDPIPLREAWAEVEARGGWANALPWQKTALEFATARSPADSISGIRALRFGGFTGRKGYGVVLHPKDMGYLGGADLDIDSAFLYQATSLPRAMVEQYRHNQNEWELRRENGMALVSSKDPKNDRTWGKTDADPLAKHPARAFSPTALLGAGKSAYDGNHILGSALNHANRFHALAEMMDAGEVGIVVGTGDAARTVLGGREVYTRRDADGNPVQRLSRGDTFLRKRLKQQLVDGGLVPEGAQVWWEATTRRSIPGKPKNWFLRLMKREGVNRAADSADGGGMVDRTQTGRIMGQAALDNIVVKYAFRDPTGRMVVRTIADRHRVVEQLDLTANAYSQAMGDVMRALKGKDYDAGRSMTLEEVVDNLKGGLIPLPNKVPSTIVEAGRLLSKLPVEATARGTESSAGGRTMTRRTPSSLGRNWPDVMKAAETIAADEGPMGQFIRQITSRVRINTLTDTRSGDTSRGTTDRDERARRDAEMPWQDYADHATMGVLYYEGRRLYDAAERAEPGSGEQVIEQLRNVAVEIATFKENQGSLLVGSQKAQERTGRYASKAKTLDQLRHQVHDYFQNLDPNLRSFAQLYYLGSLYPQHTDLQEFAPRKRAQEAYNEAHMIGDEAAKRAALDDLDAAKREWFKTNSSTSAYQMGAAGPDAIRLYFNTMRGLVEASWRDVSPADMAAALEHGSMDGAFALDRMMGSTTIGADPVRGVEGETRGNATKATESTVQKYKAPDYLREVAALGNVDLAAIAKDPAQKAEYDGIVERLSDLLYHNPEMGNDFTARFAGTLAAARQSGIATAPEVMTLRDLGEFMDVFAARRRRDIWVETEEEREQGIPLKWTDWFFFPQSFDAKHSPFSRTAIRRLVPAVTPDGVREMEVSQYMSHIGTGHDIWNRMLHFADGQLNVFKRDLQDRFGFLDKLGEDGDVLMDIAVRVREARNLDLQRTNEDGTPDGSLDYYQKRAAAARQQLKGPIGAKRYVMIEVDAEGNVQNVERSGAEVVDRIDRALTDFATSDFGTFIENEDGWAKLSWTEAEPEFGTSPDGIAARNEWRRNAVVDVRSTLVTLMGQMQSGRTPPMLGWNALSKLVHQYMLDRVEVFTDADAKAVGELGKKKRHMEEVIDSLGEAERSPIMMDSYETLQRQYAETVEAAKGRAQKLGDLRGEAKIAAQRKLLDRRDKLGWSPVGQTDLTRYFPHNGHGKNIVERFMQAKIEAMRAKGQSDDVIVAEEVAMRADHAQSEASDGAFAHDTEMWLSDHEFVSEADLFEGALKYRPGHLRSRGKNSLDGAPMPGYDTTTKALERYRSQLMKGHYNQLASLMNHVVIDDFVRNNVMGEYTEGWARFMLAFNRDAMGLPSIFPQAWLDDPNTAIKKGGPLGLTNPYYLFTDEAVDRAGRRMSAKHFGGKGSYLDGRSDLLSARVKRFSQWEGQWQLLTLLSHTKTWFNNIVFGQVNTGISAGAENFWHARDVKWLQANVDPSWTSIADRNKHIEQFGGIESYIVDEVALPERLRATRIGDFIEDVRKEVRRGGLKGIVPGSKEAKQWDLTVGEMARARGISTAVLNGAAFFMRHSEHQLRTQSWMSHYLQAREVLGMNGAAFPSDHPWLIDMANRGVQATQFIYNNANRPAFARTSIGKVFSRFQLWAWNSVRFRRDIAARAAEHGFSPNTPEMAKLKRLAVADLFVLGLAEMFPFSMFDASVPPPMQYFVDTADLFFGDDDEKRRAFFGLGEGIGEIPYAGKPVATALGLISPPSFRHLTALFNTYLTGDWRRYADYNIHTLYPFGRFGRDIRKTIENPIRFSEHLLGVPVGKAHGTLRRLRVDEPVGVRGTMTPVPDAPVGALFGWPSNLVNQPE